MTVEEYLRTTGEGPDPEFVDGRIVERNVGEDPHSEVQGKLIVLFANLAKTQPLHYRPELTLRVSRTRIRIADVAVFSERPAESVPANPPLVVVEIVSREDRHTEIIRKFEDYRRWGVPNIWLVDPWWRKIHVYRDARLLEVASLALPEFGFEIQPSQLFEGPPPELEEGERP